ncbi:DUF4254 domain-containing protein [Nocardia sp. NPDC050793]|uniref:DUF4254 domain-containing protein n=1 Tax=Nocardia sp. NPDC050793 TaxID=3155159 RepID=UPI0033C2F195
MGKGPRDGYRQRRRPESRCDCGFGPFPRAEELLSAMRGERAVSNPLARWASQLAETHRGACAPWHIVPVGERPCSRIELIDAIDLWVVGQVRHHRDDRAVHTETIGSVIDHMAAAHVRAEALLRESLPARDPRIHATWHRLAELVNGYDDLVSAVVDGERRLPVAVGGSL